MVVILLVIGLDLCTPSRQCDVTFIFLISAKFKSQRFCSIYIVYTSNQISSAQLSSAPFFVWFNVVTLGSGIACQFG